MFGVRVMARRPRKPPTRPSDPVKHAENVAYGRRHRDTRAKVLARDQYRCRYCGAPATEVDHLLSVREHGPTFDPNLLVACCRGCNEALKRSRQAGGQREVVWPKGEPWPRPSMTSHCPHYSPTHGWCYGADYHWSRNWDSRDEEPEEDES
jgi:5-methylcytosine-specific restriction endonuclease McrA